MSLPEFLTWEERQSLRYEFDGFAPIAMTGGSFAHAAIQMNLLTALGTRLRGKSCRPIGSGLKILVAGRIRYPDAFVVCSPVPNDANLVTDPVIVFEILSASTANEDLFTKNAEYRATPSIQRYVVLQQTHIGALVFSRHGDHWVDELVVGSAGLLRLPDIGIEIPLSDIYADLTFDGREESATGEPPTADAPQDE